MNMIIRGTDLHRASMLASASPYPLAQPLFAPAMDGSSAQGAGQFADVVDAKRSGMDEESIVALRRRFVDLMTPRTADGVEDEEADAAEDLRVQSLYVGTSTVAGALASLEWAREEFAGHYVEGSKKPDLMDVWTLAMLDNVLGVLRKHADIQAA